MARRVILVLGGARTGKSRFALRVADADGGRKVYLATARALDDEMRRRIERHRQERGASWRTVEEALALPETLRTVGGQCDVVVIDCMTLWLANIMGEEGASEEAALGRVRALIEAARGVDCTVVIVSNEVGGGIVPDNRLARVYRDVVGLANQMLADAAEEVFVVVAGIPLRLKPQSGGVGDA